MFLQNSYSETQTPPLSEDPSNVDEMVDYYINNTKLTYDYRSPAILEELEKMIHFIQQENTEKVVEYAKLENALQMFQARIKKFTSNCGINDVLMILAPGVLQDIRKTNNSQLIELSIPFRDLVKMNEVQRQVEAVKKMESFLRDKDPSVILQFHSKYVAWEKENCYYVSVWDD